METSNPLSANVEYTRNDSDVTCSGCSASYMKEEKICYEMVYYTLYF